MAIKIGVNVPLWIIPIAADANALAAIFTEPPNADADPAFLAKGTKDAAVAFGKIKPNINKVIKMKDTIHLYPICGTVITIINSNKVNNMSTNVAILAILI